MRRCIKQSFQHNQLKLIMREQFLATITLLAFEMSRKRVTQKNTITIYRIRWVDNCTLQNKLLQFYIQAPSHHN